MERYFLDTSFRLSEWTQQFGANLKGEERIYWEEELEKQVPLIHSDLVNMDTMSEFELVTEIGLYNVPLARQLRGFFANGPWDPPVDLLDLLDRIIEENEAATVRMMAKQTIKNFKEMLDLIEIARNLKEAAARSTADHRDQLFVEVTKTLSKGTVALDNRYVRSAMVVLFGDRAESYAESLGLDVESHLSFSRNEKVAAYLEEAGRRFAAIGRGSEFSGMATAMLAGQLVQGLEGILDNEAITGEVEVAAPARIPTKPLPVTPRIPGLVPPVVAGAESTLPGPAFDPANLLPPETSIPEPVKPDSGAGLEVALGIANAVHMLLRGEDVKEDLKMALLQATFLRSPIQVERTPQAVKILEEVERQDPDLARMILQLGAQGGVRIGTSIGVFAVFTGASSLWDFIPSLWSAGVVFLSFVAALATFAFSRRTVTATRATINGAAVGLASLLLSTRGQFEAGLELPLALSFTASLTTPMVTAMSTVAVLSIVQGFAIDYWNVPVAAATLGTLIPWGAIFSGLTTPQTQAAAYSFGALDTFARSGGSSITAVFGESLELPIGLLGLTASVYLFYAMTKVFASTVAAATQPDPDATDEEVERVDRAYNILRWGTRAGAVRVIMSMIPFITNRVDNVARLVQGTFPTMIGETPIIGPLYRMSSRQLSEDFFFRAGILPPIADLLTAATGSPWTPLFAGAVGGVILAALALTAPEQVEEIGRRFDSMVFQKPLEMLGRIFFTDESWLTYTNDAGVLERLRVLLTRYFATIAAEGVDALYDADWTPSSTILFEGLDEDFLPPDDDEPDLPFPPPNEPFNPVILTDSDEEDDGVSAGAFFKNIIGEQEMVYRPVYSEMGWNTYEVWLTGRFYRAFGTSLVELPPSFENVAVRLPKTELLGPATSLSISRNRPAQPLEPADTFAE
jgi:hypothetical protein